MQFRNPEQAVLPSRPQVRSSLSDLIAFFRLGKRTVQTIRLNLFWAFIFNILGIPLAAGVLYPVGVHLPPMFAGVAMACSSIFVAWPDEDREVVTDLALPEDAPSQEGCAAEAEQGL